MTKFRLLLNLTTFIVLAALAISLLFIHNYIASGIIFTCFYVIIYSLGVFGLISFISVLILGLIFDSITSTNIGVSSTLLLALILGERLEKSLLPKISDSIFTTYALALVNFGVLLLLAKGLSYFFQISFINPSLFYIISLPSAIIFITAASILNNYNAK